MWYLLYRSIPSWMTLYTALSLVSITCDKVVQLVPNSSWKVFITCGCRKSVTSPVSGSTSHYVQKQHYNSPLLVNHVFTFSVSRHVRYSLLSPINTTLHRKSISLLMNPSIPIGTIFCPPTKLITSAEICRTYKHKKHLSTHHQHGKQCVKNYPVEMTAYSNANFCHLERKPF